MVKICPVCDGEIAGRWCKRCHRFVTPWEIDGDIHVNERRSAKNDDLRAFYDPIMEFKRLSYKTTYSEINTPSKGKRIIGNIVFVMLTIIFLVSAIIFVTFSCIDEKQKYEVKQWVAELLDGNRRTQKEDEINFKVWNVIRYYNPAKNYTKLLRSEPEYIEEQGEYRILYFNDEDVIANGEECDEPHLDKNFDQEKYNIQSLLGVYTDNWIEGSYSDNYVVADSQDNAVGIFQTTYYGYVEAIGLNISVYCDTVSEEIHSYIFSIKDKESVGEFVQFLCRFNRFYGFDEVINGEEGIMAAMEECILNGRSDTYCAGDMKLVFNYIGEGYIMAGYSPIEE